MEIKNPRAKDLETTKHDARGLTLSGVVTSCHRRHSLYAFP